MLAKLARLYLVAPFFFCRGFIAARFEVFSSGPIASLSGEGVLRLLGPVFLALSTFLLLAFSLLATAGTLATPGLDSRFSRFIVSVHGLGLAMLVSLGYVVVRTRLVTRQL